MKFAVFCLVFFVVLSVRLAGAQWYDPLGWIHDPKNNIPGVNNAIKLGEQAKAALATVANDKTYAILSDFIKYRNQGLSNERIVVKLVCTHGVDIKIGVIEVLCNFAPFAQLPIVNEACGYYQTAMNELNNFIKQFTDEIRKDPTYCKLMDDIAKNGFEKTIKATANNLFAEMEKIGVEELQKQTGITGLPKLPKISG